MFTPDEFSTLENSINVMLEALDSASQLASDPPDSTWTPVGHGTGKMGRPLIEFDPIFLSFALQVRGPTDIAATFGCSARTVRRRALQYGILPHGDAPFENRIEDDGTITQVYQGPPRHTRLSNISDDELDVKIRTILRDFPKYGRRMIDGRLRSLSIRVPRERIRQSYQRVFGPPPSFIRQPIARRKYSVAGVNSLWHHDGQHGKYFILICVFDSPVSRVLIKEKLVVHAFIDGKTRFVTGIRVHNNNRASTVVKLFHEARHRHGTPRRVRGDHGTENIRVAKWVDEHKGPGSYLWGP